MCGLILHSPVIKIVMLITGQMSALFGEVSSHELSLIFLL